MKHNLFTMVLEFFRIGHLPKILNFDLHENWSQDLKFKCLT
jgi:hypothetical protein